VKFNTKKTGARGLQNLPVCRIKPSKKKKRNVSRPDFYRKASGRALFLLFGISSIVKFSRSELAK